MKKYLPALTILFIVAIVITILLFSCNKRPDLSEACRAADSILSEAMNDESMRSQDTDVYISYDLDEDSKTFTIRGKLNGRKEAMIIALKNNTSNPSWLNEGVIENLKKEIPEDDKIAKKFFFDMMTNEYGERIKACFDGINITIIYKYTDAEKNVITKTQ